ncbi:hypothetical protein N9D31_01940 [Oligoflexaceae bacterium]|nr:hypothetical protein [Oligoflexaceae bacterium]
MRILIFLTFLSASMPCPSALAAQCDSTKSLVIRSSSADWTEYSLDSSCRYDGEYKRYKDHRLTETGSYLSGHLDGRQKMFRRDGTISEVTDYKAGLAEGVRENYFRVPVDAVRWRISLKSGLKDGLYQKYNSTQNLIEQISYKHGVVEGVSSHRAEPYSLSNYSKISRRYLAGQLIEEGKKEKKGVITDLSVGEIAKYKSVTVTEREILASFRMSDITDRVRLSILLPSDICSPEIDSDQIKELKGREWQHFSGVKHSENVCLSLKRLSNMEIGYRLFDRQGYLKEKGSLIEGERDGFISFYRKGRPVYMRKYNSGEPEPEIYFKKQDRIVMNELIESTKSSLHRKERLRLPRFEDEDDSYTGKKHFSFSKNQAVCLSPSHVQKCKRIVSKLMRSDEMKKDGILLSKVLCEKNLAHSCGAYSTYLKREKDFAGSRQALIFGCEHEDEQSCYRAGELMKESRKIDAALQYWRGSCLRGSSDKVVSLSALSQSRSCRALAYHYRDIGKEAKSKEYLCMAQSKVNPDSACLDIKVLGNNATARDSNSFIKIERRFF